jgi:hypothetical protein
MSGDAEFSVGDTYEGVLLETCQDENRSITRPRVRPLEHFPRTMRVEFPRHLREKYLIGTRFRADVTVAQKHWSTGLEKAGQHGERALHLGVRDGTPGRREPPRCGASRYALPQCRIPNGS